MAVSTKLQNALLYNLMVDLDREDQKVKARRRERSEERRRQSESLYSRNSDKQRERKDRSRERSRERKDGSSEKARGRKRDRKSSSRSSERSINGISKSKHVKHKKSRLRSKSRSNSKSKVKSSSRSKRRSKSRSSSESKSKSKLKSRSRSRSKTKPKPTTKLRLKSRSKSRSTSKSKRKSRSRSKLRSRSKSKEKSRSRSKSRSKSKEKSRSSSKSKEKPRSRSKSKEKSRSRSKSKEKSRSRSKSKQKSRSRSKSKPKSKSRSKSKEKSRSRSTSKSGSTTTSKSGSTATSKSRSRSRSKSKPKSRSRSGSKASSIWRLKSRSRSRSKSQPKSRSRSRSKSKSESRSRSNSVTEIVPYISSPKSCSSIAESSPDSYLKSMDNILDTPEIFKQNFGGTTAWDLANCSIAKQFWYDPDHIDTPKYFIGLHEARGDFKRKRLFSLKEQIGVAYPTFHLLKFRDLLEKLEKVPQKRIWLDVRDSYTLFEQTDKGLLPKSLESAVTHFSFGPSLNTTGKEIRADDLMKPIELLRYIFDHLPNLEYCSINSGMLRKSMEQPNPRVTFRLRRLKTLRFIHTNLKFPIAPIDALLRVSRNLEQIYGIPLHFIKDLPKSDYFGEKTEKMRSVYMLKRYYSCPKAGATHFLEDLENIGRGLEELDTRTSFLSCRTTTRAKILERMNKILARNADTLRKITIEPCACVKLKLPKMRNLTMIQFHMNFQLYKQEQGGLTRGRNQFQDPVIIKKGCSDQCHILPSGFDLARNFPRLIQVELCKEISRAGRVKNRLDNRKDQHGQRSRIKGSGGVDDSEFDLMDLADQLTMDIMRKNGYEISSSPALKQFYAQFPPSIFPAGCFSRVQSLRLFGFTNVECAPRMKELFPNLKILRIHNAIGEVAEFLPRCYGLWPELRELHLEIAWDTNCGHTFDAAFSGIDDHRCRDMQEDVVKRADELDETINKFIDKYQTNLPIWHLTKLSLLRFELRPSGCRYALGKLPIFTRIGGLAISRLCKKVDPNAIPGFRIQVAFAERMNSSEKKETVLSIRPILSDCLDRLVIEH